MSFVDAQVRRFVTEMLRDVAAMVDERDVPFERFGESAMIMNKGREILDRETGQRFYGLVYVLFSESQEATETTAQVLLEAHGMGETHAQ